MKVGGRLQRKCCTLQENSYLEQFFQERRLRVSLMGSRNLCPPKSWGEEQNEGRMWKGQNQRDEAQCDGRQEDKKWRLTFALLAGWGGEFKGDLLSADRMLFLFPLHCFLLCGFFFFPRNRRVQRIWRQPTVSGKNFKGRWRKNRKGEQVGLLLPIHNCKHVSQCQTRSSLHSFCAVMTGRKPYLAGEGHVFSLNLFSCGALKQQFSS